jgi:hypothetical protein
MNIIKKFLIRFLHKEIEQIKYACTVQEKEAKVQENLRIQKTIMEDCVGQKVIYCSNEWADPLFGTVVAIVSFTNTSDPMYAVEDAFGGCPRYCFNGTLYYADEKMVDAILRLDPFERWNMNLARGYINPNMWEKCYPPICDITPPAILKQKLKDVGFI